MQKVLLKLSGELLLGDQDAGIDFASLREVAAKLKKFRDRNDLALGIVIGAGNIWRFRDSDGSGIDRTTADKMGMLATIMNGVALASALNELGQKAVCLSAFPAPMLVADYDIELARDYLAEGYIVLLAGGTTNPYFTTDSAAVLRALELDCEVLLKATKVDGIYDKDPMKDPSAKRYEKLTYDEAIAQKLQVMDLTAMALARDNNLPLKVFAFENDEALWHVLEKPEYSTAINS